MPAKRIDWSPRGASELKRLLRHLHIHSPAAARKAAVVIQTAALQLADFPNSGRPYPRNPMRYRELLVPFGRFGYSILYEVEGEVVRISNVKHQREAGY